MPDVVSLERESPGGPDGQLVLQGHWDEDFTSTLYLWSPWEEHTSVLAVAARDPELSPHGTRLV
jgi:hypothetical protein